MYSSLAQLMKIILQPDLADDTDVAALLS